MESPFDMMSRSLAKMKLINSLIVNVEEGGDNLTGLYFVYEDLANEIACAADLMRGKK